MIPPIWVDERASLPMITWLVDIIIRAVLKVAGQVRIRLHNRGCCTIQKSFYATRFGL